MTKPRIYNGYRSDLSLVLRAAGRRFLDLGREERGAVLVITLAMFFLMYLGCMGVYAISMAVKDRIQLQNAADAAAYSAAVVQADTLSRIATINRAMAWTYVDMTRLQMDYIVRRWLDHTCLHYDQDYNGANGHDGLKEYNKNSILYKLHVKASPLGPNEPCEVHKSFGVGYYIGADEVSPLMIHLNGRGANKYTMPKGAKGVKLPQISSGHTELESYVKLKIAEADANYLIKYGRNAISEMSTIAKDVLDISEITYKCLKMSNASAMTRTVLLDNLSQAQNIDVSFSGDVSDLMKARITMNKLAIIKMNVCERYLALQLPNKVETCVQNVLKANLEGTQLDLSTDQISYMVSQYKALGTELLNGLPFSLFGDCGYLHDILNNTAYEEKFLSFANHTDIYETFDTGINQWFVRGNGSRRTEGEFGIQRCYKHMTKSWIASESSKEPLSDYHATHNPLEPTCWNTKKLEDAENSCALFSEWIWWTDTWYCFRIWVPIPPGYITIHLNVPHYKEIWPSRASCPHNSKPGLLGLKSGELTMPDWSSYFNVGSLISAAKSACIKKKKWRPPRFRSHDYTSNIDFGLGALVRRLASLDNLLGNYEPIERYHDGCFVWPDLLSHRASICKFTGYSRLYADDPHIYNSTYVGVKAYPLLLDQRYFDRYGTISVGIRQKNRNIFLRIFDKIDGVFKAFNQDWDERNPDTYTFVFSSAKAGWRNKWSSQAQDDYSSRNYRIDWDPFDQSWNLCQSDWDAVFVPVPRAYSAAQSLFWKDGDDDMLDEWVFDGNWVAMDGSPTSVNAKWTEISAPRGVLSGGGHEGILDWEGVSHVMFH